MKLFSRKKKREELQWSDSSNYKRHEQLNKQPELLQKPEEPKTMETEREEPVMSHDRREEIPHSRQEKMQYVRDCCDEILESSARLTEAKKEYKAVNAYMEDVRRVKLSEEEDGGQLAYYSRRIQNLRKDQESYRNYGTKIPENMYQYISANEKDMSVILKELHDDENYMQALKTDLHNIEGEKSALIYEQKDCQKKIAGMRTIAYVIMGAMAVVLGGMFYFHLNTDYDFTIGILLSILGTALAVALIMVYYQKNVREIRLNEKKMKKAVGLLNKYRLLYANVKSRVDYTYKKLGIRNSYELNNYWRLYLTAKKERQVYHGMSRELDEAQEQYDLLIDSMGLSDSSVWKMQMEAVTDASVMKEMEDSLNRRKKGLRKTMDFNKKQIEKYKEKVKDLTRKEPDLAEEILKIVEDRENSL